MTPKIIDKIKKILKDDYNIELSTNDIYYFQGAVYIITSKVAALFGTGYQNFSSVYSNLLKKAGVRAISIGRHNYYEFSGIKKLLDKMVSQDKTALEICRNKIAKLKLKRKR